MGRIAMGSAPQLNAIVDTLNGVASIAFTGELDLATVPVLEDHLSPFENDGVAAIMVDLRDVAFTDSTGVHALLEARQRINAGGRRFIMVGARPSVRRVFALTGNESLLNDRDAAGVLDRFTRGRANQEGPAAAEGADDTHA
jgi:anti-sigma B factor antagonist